MNVFQFEDLFGNEFGRVGNKYVYPDRSSSKYRVKFRTPNKILEQVGFGIGGSALGRMLDGTVMLRVFYGDDPRPIYEAEDLLNFNVNPDVSLQDLVGKNNSDRPGFSPGNVVLPPKDFIADNHLEPETDYILEVERLEGDGPQNPDGTLKQPVPLRAFVKGNNAHFGNLPETSEPAKPKPPEEVPVGSLAINISGVDGTWTPNS